MAGSGRIQRIQWRLTFAIVLTAVIPLLAAIALTEFFLRTAVERFDKPDMAIGRRLDKSLDVYQELAREMKQSMRTEAKAIAERPRLHEALRAEDPAGLQRELARAFRSHPRLVSLSVNDGNSDLARVAREKPFDPKREKDLVVRLPLSDRDEESEPMLLAVFAVDKARFDERDEMASFVDQYKRVAQRYEPAYLSAYALLLGMTVMGAIAVGVLLARGVSQRIGTLAEAMRYAGAGDLGIRVREGGPDELADLAQGFNRMLGEIEQSRARIEYLQRIEAWQEMARRLAHEIKNPLTPIQLAVQDIHRRYSGADPEYRRLLDATLEIIEDEVGTLRRLVTEFSDFARLPQAQLEEADLNEFLREQRERISLLEDEFADARDSDHGAIVSGVAVEFDLPDEAARVYIDRQMLRRAFINLTRNAAQAIHGAGIEPGRIRVALARHGDYWVVDVEDNGPGIVAEMRVSAFDPYVTTKTEGTGLGLAIVKKIVVEHGGSIAAEQGSLGGARVRIWLPALGTPAAAAAFEARDWQQPPSSRRSGLHGPSVGSPS